MQATAGQRRRGLQLGVKGKILSPIVILGSLLALGAGWYITRHTTRQVEQAAVEKAEGLANQIRTLRGYYTQNVVSGSCPTVLR